MSTPIPGRIVVGPYRYDVVLDDALMDKESVKDRKHLAGLTDSPSCKIAIRPGYSHDYEAETMMHEVLHAAYHAGGGDSVKSPDVETVICHLAATLLATLRNNPALVAYLVDVESD
jgi:hypothetical protein